MLSYELFKKTVVESFKNYLPENLQNMQVKTHVVYKTNRELDGISLCGDQKVDRGGVDASPTMYINDLYDRYRATCDLPGTIRSAAEAMTSRMSLSFNAPDLLSMDLSDKIIFKLVNTMANEHMLETVPHREYLDLSITYRIVFELGEEGCGTALLTNQLAKTLGYSEEELYELAMVNTARRCPLKAYSLMQAQEELAVAAGMDIEDDSTALDLKMDIWAVMVERPEGGSFLQAVPIEGPYALVFTDVLRDLADEIESDLLIAPSSTSEVVVVSAGFFSPELLAGMVYDINRSAVCPEERLSDSVYYYNRQTDEISIAVLPVGNSFAYC